MDVDKALYMAEFLNMREELGKVEYYPMKHTLYINLYDEFKPTQQQADVSNAMEGIHESRENQESYGGLPKTIHLVNKADQHIFFPDIEDHHVNALEEDIHEEAVPVDDIKHITMTGGNIIQGSGTGIKKISINPEYVSQ
jgi:hypothetical protein